MLLRRRALAHAWRASLVAGLAGAAVLAPIQMARGTPETRFAAIPAGVAATPGFAAATATRGPAAVTPTAGPVLDTPFPLSHLAVRWTGAEDAVVELRWATEGGELGPWRQLLVDEDSSHGGAGRVNSELIRVDHVDRVQARAAGDAHHIELVAIDTIAGPRPLRLAVGTPRAMAADGDDEGGPGPSTTSTTTDPGSSTTSSSSSSTSSTTTTTGDGPDSAPEQRTAAGTYGDVPQPRITTRAEWGADESLRKNRQEYAPITKLFVHHTVTNLSADDPDPAATVRAIYAYHTQGNGWDDIGYNFLVDPTGRIYEGRWARDYEPGETPTGENTERLGVAGAHASNFNHGSAAVAVIGDFTNAAPTNAAIKSVEALLAWKADRHNIDVNQSAAFTAKDGTVATFANLAGHRDVGKTACPGDKLYPILPSIRKNIAGLVKTANSPTRGYWTATADGRVIAFGEAQHVGSMANKPLAAPIVGMAPTPSGGGYWLLGGDGGVFSFGDAAFYGSTGAIKLNKPVVRMEPTPSGRGYWLVASDGGIFAFGDAAFWGSTGAMTLNKPVVGMDASPTGKGYWLVASDGGIFAFGDALFHGSTGAMTLVSPVVSMAARPDGAGYWLVAKDGGVFAFDTPFLGSVPAMGIKGYPGAVQLRATKTGAGYYVGDTAGGIYAFGDASFLGADTTQKAPRAAVDLVLRPDPPKAEDVIRTGGTGSSTTTTGPGGSTSSTSSTSTTTTTSGN